MAHHVAVAHKLYLDEHDLSGDLSATSLDFGAPLLDHTTFSTSSTGGTVWRKRIAGIREVAFSHQGFVSVSESSNSVDDILNTAVGVQNSLVTNSGPTGAVGDVAYFTRGIYGQYQIGGAVGEVLPFSVSGEGHDVLVRGRMMLTGTQTTSTNGTSQQLGTLPSGSALYGALHVTAFNGTSATIKILSDNSSGMATPSTAATFTAATAVTSEWLTPVTTVTTDDWWQADLSGTFTSLTFYVAVGIQSESI